MTPAEFDRFTEGLRARLEADARVLALVALGSTALPERRDHHSDHDFWIIVTPGARESFLEDTSWLPNGEDVAAPIRVRRYLVALYDTGHVMEVGVFEPDELSEGKLEAYRILFDRHGIEAQLDEIARQSIRRPTLQEDRTEYQRLLITLLTGASRALRGEHLSAHKYIHYFALDFLLDLLARHKPSARSESIDTLDPWRRFDQLHPALAAELYAAARLPAVEAAVRLLDLAERELGPVLPDYPTGTAAVVRSALQRLCLEVAHRAP